ncbi:MAG: hypothetical protein NZ480_00655 [Bdellovibrionaceae bacterium]|nr:hypothetical protein [Pseudobdellovibrionaceae bacterium]MDW8190989.1 hypothetical protein [Pseudobdellovibrionaceae bacterium]
MGERQEIFWLVTVGLGAFFWLLFRWGRRATLQDHIKPLDLKAEGRPTSLGNMDSTTQEILLSERRQPVRPLQVFFIYNGHTFDAYEVLGVPNGADLERVFQAYQQLKTHTHSDIIDVAYNAILEKSGTPPEKINGRS